jgi:hypothetical protein
MTRWGSVRTWTARSRAGAPLVLRERFERMQDELDELEYRNEPLGRRPVRAPLLA